MLSFSACFLVGPSSSQCAACQIPRSPSSLPYPPVVVDTVTGFEYLRRKRELPTVPGFDLEYLPSMVPIICHVSFTNMAGNMPR